ncbi:MAG: hypothetical protein JST54_09215 [Deltaproteobacteria bacterium]|nr:hypothetical protein [Deltaproteobacteria bacterium]
MLRARLALIVAPLMLAACFTPLTQQDVDQYGTRAYPHASKSQAYHASLAALKSLGYETAVTEPGSGRIKTAPKILVVHAHGSSTVASATESSLAWDIDVSPGARGSIVRARPRGYEGGQALSLDKMNADYMKRTYDTLFAEIESNLAHH